MQVIDPAGTVRGDLPASASFEQIVAVAWRLGPSDYFLVVADDTHHWSLTIYRPGRVPVTQPLDVRGVYAITEDNQNTTRAAMLETAWLDLVDDGWSVRDAVE